MKKNITSKLAIFTVTLALSVSFAGNAFAARFKQQRRGEHGMWIQDYNDRWWYQYDNGDYPRSTWYKDDGNWYYFESDGYMAASKWVYNGDGWFYLDGRGIMLRNTTIDGKYYVNDRGAWEPTKDPK